MSELNDIPRNPWKGISAWKEFKYDMRHLSEVHQRFKAGIKGQNPELESEWRVFGIAMIVTGSLYFFGGLTAVIIVNFT